MPQVNLTNVSGQELRQLLDSSRRRGDAALSYRILQEMAARREAPAERRAFKARHPAEPHLVAVEFGDPLDKTEDLPPMPNWRPPGHETGSQAAPSPEPVLAAAPQPRRSRRAPRADRALAMAAAAQASFAEDDDAPPLPSAPLDADRPLSLRDFDPEPFVDPAEDPPPPPSGFQPIELGVPRKPPKSRGRLLAGAVLGVLLGAAVGWLGGWLARDGMSRLAAPAAAPAPVQVAAVAPPPITPPVADTPAAETPLGPGDAQPAPEANAAPAAPAAKGQEAPPVADGTVMELPAPGAEEAEADAARTAKAEKAAKAAERARERTALAQGPDEAPAVAKGCASQPTPADRTICGDARLKHLQAELRRAYDEALDAHEDRALLREHQLAWRDTRSAVADPERLARLYEQRIRKLNAATAEARRSQR